jgi:hypothetical protein
MESPCDFLWMEATPKRLKRVWQGKAADYNLGSGFFQPGWLGPEGNTEEWG